MRHSLFRKWFNSRKGSPVRRSGRFRPRLDPLEDRLAPAVLAVGSGEQYPTIQGAVNAANPGDTILVDAGTYPELVSVNKSLTIDGAQHGIDARTRSGPESSVDGAVNGNNRTTSFYITANNVTIDGFTVRDQSDPNQFGAGIVMSSGTSGVDILNNIITNNAMGIYANSGGASLIQHNLFDGNNTVLDGNNNPEPAGGSSIYSELTNHLTIDANEFKNQTQNNPVIFAATAAGVHQSLRFTNNSLDNSVAASAVYCVGIAGGVFSGNSITTEGNATGIRLGGADSNISITDNNIYNVFRGVGVLDDGYGLGNNSNVVIHLNSITNVAGAGAVDVDASYSGGLVDASGNWWGTAIGANPSDPTAPTAIDGLMSGPVTIGSFLNSGANAAVGNGFVPASATEMWVPETSGTSGLTRVDGKIQSGIDTALSGMTVRVAADTYPQNVIVATPVTLLGANAGINPNTGLRSAETIVEPGLASSFDTSSVILVAASNVTIDGLTVQGSIASPSGGQSAGSTLVSGTKVYAAVGISNSSNVNTGGSAPSTTDISALTVQNNIIQDFTQVGVYGDTSDGTPSTGNSITDNFITDVPNNGQGGYIGEGIIIYDNFYADVTANTLTKVRTGIQTGNNYLPSGTFAPSISSNHVSAYVKGVYFNLQYESASTFTVSNNTITQGDATVSPAYNVGLLIQSIQGSVTAVIQGNNVSGFLYGIEFGNSNATTPVTAAGGTLNDNTYGVWDTNNDYFYPAPYHTSAAIDGVTITNSTRAGIWIDSTSPNSNGQFDTTDSTTLAITGSTSVSGGPVGLLVDGSLSLVTGLTLNDTSFSGQSGSFITLAHGAEAGHTIDATGARFDGQTGATATLAQNFAIEDRLTHAVDDGSLGFVRVKAANVFVTPNSFNPPATTTPSIQRGINAAAAGDTVNVAAGAFAENLVINKAITVLGAQAGANANTRYASFTTGVNGPKANPAVETVITAPVVNPTGGNPNANDLVRVLASNITLDGLVLDGNNPALPASSVTGNGVNIDARRGIQNSDANNNFVDINNLLVENTIIQNFAQRGIELANDSTSSTGNLITGNVIHNFGSDPVNGGQGIILFTNAYADISHNTIVDDVGGQIGLHLQNFYANGTMTWSGNNVTVGQGGIGIHANLFYAPAGVLNIQNNIVNAAPGVTGTDGVTWGINVWSVQVGSTVAVSNNTVGAGGGQFARGINLWNLPTSNTVTVSGGSVANAVVGINLDSVDPYFGAGAATTVNVSGVVVSGGTIGVRVRAATVSQFLPPPSSVDPTASVAANLTDVTITGAATGVLVQGFSSSITASATLYRNTISGNGTGIAVKANGNLGSITQKTAQNFITGNTTGIAIASGAGTVQPIYDNDLSGNSGYAVSNLTSPLVDATGNWWGSNLEAGVAAKANGQVNFTGWLGAGTDTQPATPGFQGDFSPFITSTNNATFAVGQAGPAFTVTTAGDPPPSLSIPPGSLPGGLSFTDNGDGTASINGTPDAGTGGTYIFAITAHNGAGTDATQTFTVTV
jgi:hypothetical protein